MPAVLVAILALITRDTRPLAYRVVAATTAIVLAHALSDAGSAHALSTAPVLTRGVTTDAEQYTYSAVWLAFGVVLLLAGIRAALAAGAARLRRGGRPHHRQGVPHRHGRR